MFVYSLPSILTHFQPILIENLSNPIRINPESIYFPCLGSLAGVMFRGMSLFRQDQMLGIVVAKEEPATEEKRQNLVVPLLCIGYSFNGNILITVV